jgi:phospholipid/cholesterol/gamma-HCH transport system substrate-binding protein
VKRAIRTHLRDFIAIFVLLILAVGVSGYILTQERLQWPWESPYEINAAFSSGQAVMPGQGQTVRVSGVQIGQVGQVKLDNGIAVVQLNISPKFKHLVHQDWTALLRPKTGLKDMFIELQPPPGGSHAPVAGPGYTIPVSNTNPDVNPDEILNSLDADTRSYLELLVNGAGAGLQAPGGGELAELLKRFLPTHMDLARLDGAVAQRGDALRSLIHSLHVLNAAVATKQTQIVQLIDSSSKVFHAFANANQGISQAVKDLPGTLDQTTATLQKVQRFADILAPATHNLLPAVEEIPAANAATIALAKPGAPVVKNEIRPFVVAARPLVRSLQPASINLAKATPNLSKVFTVLNHLLNMVGYFPGGNQHGYLWWLAWGDHDARTLFSTQDANGDFRPLFLQASCATYEQVVQNEGALSLLVLNLLPILGDTGLCPGGISSLKSGLRTYERSYDNQMAESGQKPSAMLKNFIKSAPTAASSSSASSSTLQSAVGALTSFIHGKKK